METLQIREAVRSDSKSIFNLIKELANVKGEGDNIQIKQQDVQKGFDDDPPHFSGFVAEIKEEEAKSPRVVGVALFHLKYSTWLGPVMHLNTFVITEKYRKQGVGTKLLERLGKESQAKKYQRISFEVSKNNESGINFFLKHKAANMTKEEAWLNYECSSKATKGIIEGVKESENINIRTAEPKDCVRIREMIQELAEFEKMSSEVKLVVKDLQRDGFYKLFPDYYAFVADMTDPETGEEETIGFCILFLTFHPFKGKRVHLEDLYVTPKHRGKNVGQLLLQSVSKFVTEGKYNGFTLEVLDWNTKAIGFYDKWGFVNNSAGDKGLQSFRIVKEALAALAKD